VPYLPRHDGAPHAFPLKGLDQLRQFPQRKPENRNRPMRFDPRKSFFFDCGHHHFVTLRARRVQYEKRKLAVASDEA